MFAGIADIRDESDRNGIRAVIEVRKDYDPKRSSPVYTNILICRPLLVLIWSVSRTVTSPKRLSLMEIVDRYIRFQKDIVTRRTQYDAEKAPGGANIYWPA